MALFMMLPAGHPTKGKINISTAIVFPNPKIYAKLTSGIRRRRSGK
jgi:hypothetical protein